MDNKLKLTGIEIQTKNSKKIMLTLDEAKQLYQQLNALFGNKDNLTLIPITIYDHRWAWAHPYTQISYSDTLARVESASGITLIYNYNADEAGE